MASPPTPAVRLEAMLVLGRLAARNRACQQDAVREGVVPVLVDMMMQGELWINFCKFCIQPAEQRPLMACSSQLCGNSQS